MYRRTFDEIIVPGASISRDKHGRRIGPLIPAAVWTEVPSLSENELLCFHYDAEIEGWRILLLKTVVVQDSDDA